MIALVLLLIFSLSWSLTLEEAKELALKNHIDSVKSLLELKRLEERIREVRGGILPTIILSATYTKWDTNYISSFVPENKYFLNLRLNQPIFDKSVWSALKLARRSKKLQTLVKEEVKQRLLAEVEKLYWGVLLKREILREKEESLKYWETYFALVEEKYKRGIIPRFEFLRARSQLRQARANLIRAQSDLKSSLNSLKSFLGLSSPIELEGEFKKVEFSVKDAFSVLKEKNPTLKVLRASLEVYKARIELSKSPYYPKLSFFFNYNLENIMDFEGGQLKEDYRHGYNFGLRLDYTLYEGSKRSAKTRQEEIQLKKTLEELRFTENKLKNELESLLTQLRSAHEELLARQDSLLASQEALNFSTQRYAEGVGTQVELLEARRNYEEAKLSYLRAIYNYNSLVADIKKLLGEF
ncbi:MAG: TolC family protein [Aquificae bacterium]|nr:TolC family protein [Aquificota bacterium]